MIPSKTMEDIPVFSISPNPTGMFLTPKLKDAVLRFHRAIRRRQGLCAILGANGLGKSTLLRYILSDFEGDPSCQVAYLPDSRTCGPSTFSFLKTISEDFGIGPKRSQAAQLQAIEDVMKKAYGEGKNSILFIDESQRLSLDVFEVIRALLNCETDTHKLLQVVIAGQNDLRDRLLRDSHKAVRSRIVAPIVMQPLSLDETGAMIQFRLDKFNLENPFTPGAISEIYLRSFGVPRNILSLCQQAYDLGDGERLITEADVHVAHERLQIEDVAGYLDEDDQLATAVV
jgi:general secretion pathway protein A